jgi:hypothetical protein
MEGEILEMQHIRQRALPYGLKAPLVSIVLVVRGKPTLFGSSVFL